MKILVTGGAGFIGSNFIYYLLEHRPDTDVVCFDKLTYAGNVASLKPLEGEPRFRFYRGDIADAAAVEELFSRERPDVVVNFAAESHVDRSIDSPQVFLQTNVLGTGTLLDACRKYPVSRFHQVSTDEVYGDLPLGRRDLFFTEDSPLKPSSPYSASKASADVLCLSYLRTYGVPVTISRSSNNYGPRQFPEKLIPLAIARALNDRPVPVYGTGENVRDWLYVTDQCRALDLLLDQGEVGKVYNFGGGEERSNLEVIKGVLSALSVPDSLIEYVPDRKGHDLRYALSCARAEKELGWRPAVSFADGIERTVRWYLEHRDWWENILSGKYLKENSLVRRI